MFSDRQGDRVFQMRAHGQAVRERLLAMDGKRRISARPPENEFPPQNHPEDGIVDVPDDRPVVDEKKIRNAGKTNQRLPLVDADRFVRQIAAGRDNGKIDFPHQEMMQGSVGQHHSQIRIVRGYIRCNRLPDPVRFAFEKDNGRLRRSEQPGFERRNRAILPNLLERGVHQRKRLFLAVLSLPQSIDGLGISSIRDKMKSSKSFNRNDLSFSNCFGRLQKRIVTAGKHAAGRIPQLQRRAADGTGIRLGMKSPVLRIFVFGPAVRRTSQRISSTCSGGRRGEIR